MEKECKCVVCKRPVDPVLGLQTESGVVCSSVCQQYLNERNERGINESDDLNEVQMIL